MVPSGSTAFLLFILGSTTLMMGFLDKTQSWVLKIKEPDSGHVDAMRWRKTVIKLYHLSLWLGFLAGAIIST
ncbi:hypothetical protein E2P71_04600 [Candidatus Bathyarchaeota archaeon]|nr:hypothetical protein E2P71_04600 [Candidatus Bathyarchaeota archaeon]